MFLCILNQLSALRTNRSLGTELNEMEESLNYLSQSQFNSLIADSNPHESLA